ncbi:hypothetical protein D3C84_318560 [compost metagenome]
MCHGAPFITLRVEIRCPRPAIISSNAAHSAEIALMGIPSGSRAKHPSSRIANTPQPAKNVALSWIAVFGSSSWCGS